jgi:hypothetical protein
MVAPAHEHPGSAQGPDPSTWQCMLSMWPHRHAPRIGCETWLVTMAWIDRKRDAKADLKPGGHLADAAPEPLPARGSGAAALRHHRRHGGRG